MSVREKKEGTCELSECEGEEGGCELSECEGEEGGCEREEGKERGERARYL